MIAPGLPPANVGAAVAVGLADIPERRQDLVAGEHVVGRPHGSGRPVAVRITDVLGEEVLVLSEP